METEIWNIFENVKQTLEENDVEDTESFSSDKKKDAGCYNCLGYYLVHDNGVIVCTKCGVENGSIIDYQQEWRFYGSDDSKHTSDPTRCGMPINPLLPDSSYGTIILGWGPEKFRKLNNWNSMTYKERSLLKVFKHIQSKSEEEDIPMCIVDRAKIMYKTLSEDSIKRGKSRKGLIAACLYYSCKDKNKMRNTREISNIFDLKVRKMTNGCKQFNEMMYHNNNEYSNNMEPPSAENFIERYCAKLGINAENKTIILHVAKIAYILGIVFENTPPSVAIGSIYFVSQNNNLGISKKLLAETCDISEVTISKSYKKMQKFKKYLLP